MTELILSEQDINRDSSSYVDPNGFVFHYDGNIYRAVHEASRPFYQKLLDEGRLKKLTENFGLVPTEIADLQLSEHPNCLILRHEKISPLTYCVEWCPSMLRAAAISTLSLAEELAKQGMTLQDAYPWNVLFQGTKPVFVDVTSIVAEDPQVMWPAHEQFEAFFYRPLVLASQGLGNTARLQLLDNIEGLSLDDFYRLTSASYRTTHPGLFLSKVFSRGIQGSAAAKQRLRTFAESAAKYLTPEVRVRFLQRLQRRVRALRLAPPTDPWKNYYAEIPENVDKEKKLAKVQELLEQLKPTTVLDLGCNTGVFSLAAAKQGARVVSIDSSEGCVESLFHRAEAEELPITPLVMNVLCTTPGFGLMGSQYAPLIERVRSDVVMCLGLMHHLHLSGRQTFERITQLLSAVSERHLIFEFVAIDDANNELLPQRRTIDYTLETVRDSLSQQFPHIEIFKSDRSTRRLLLCSKE